MVVVLAELVASVARLVASVGQRVTAGDTLLIVESMKMEIPVLAPVDGAVVELTVAPADVVQEGDVLAVLDPAGAARP